MTTMKRAAAVALTAGLGLGLAGMAAPNAFAAPVPVEFRNDAGADNTMPQYVRLSPGDTTLTSFGTLYTEAGEPISNRVVAVYLYTDGQRGAQLGAGVTRSDGQFRFNATLPSGWSDMDNFNVQLAFDDVDPNDGVEYESAEAVLEPVASGTPSPSATASSSTTATPPPATSPAPAAPSQPERVGGLAKTGA